METDVVVIGGGATGTGVAWDLTLRGLRVTLVEMGDVATGTSGRYHGQLHTGARYVTSDLKSAKECWQEHTTIRKVAPHVLDDTGGMFVLSPSDDEGYVDDWLEGCEAAGIPAQEITTSEALRREPLVHPKIGRAFRLPDASCDSFALCGALRRSAESGGATFLTYHRVDGFHREDGRMSGLRATDLRTGETEDVRASFVVNAAGPWAAEVGKKAGVEFRMVLSRGAMFAFNGRWTTAIVSRLRPPGDGDIFVPLGYLGGGGDDLRADRGPRRHPHRGLGAGARLGRDGGVFAWHPVGQDTPRLGGREAPVRPGHPVVLRRGHPRGQPQGDPHLRRLGPHRAGRRRGHRQHRRRQAHDVPPDGREDRRRRVLATGRGPAVYHGDDRDRACPHAGYER